jgi:HSP20 family molecular chaperone IbpA
MARQIDESKGQIEVKKRESIFEEVRRMQDEIRERAYDLFRSGEFAAGPLDNWLRAERERVWRPAVELRQKDGMIELEAALAGVDPKDLDVQVTPSDILITANAHHQHEADEGTVHVCEFEKGRLFRSVHLPQPIDPDSAKADYRDGLLHLTARTTPETVRTIEVQTP